MKAKFGRDQHEFAKSAGSCGLLSQKELSHSPYEFEVRIRKSGAAQVRFLVKGAEWTEERFRGAFLNQFLASSSILSPRRVNGAYHLTALTG